MNSIFIFQYIAIVFIGHVFYSAVKITIGILPRFLDCSVLSRRLEQYAITLPFNALFLSNTVLCGLNECGNATNKAETSTVRRHANGAKGLSTGGLRLKISKPTKSERYIHCFFIPLGSNFQSGGEVLVIKGTGLSNVYSHLITWVADRNEDVLHFHYE